MTTIKKYMTLLIVLTITSSAIYAQRPEKMVNVVTENLVESLNHDVDGVVAASIYNSLFLSKYYPEAEINRVVNELNELAVNSDNASIRYKAQLAVLYLTNYDVAELNLQEYKQQQEKLFRDISQKLQERLLVISN